MISTRDSFFTTDDEFSYDKGFMIAFGITAYDDNREHIEDPTYGTIKAYYKTWGLNEQKQTVDFVELPTSMCTA